MTSPADSLDAERVDSLLIPDLDGLPEADDAEPDDAGVEHTASPAEVDAATESTA